MAGEGLPQESHSPRTAARIGRAESAERTVRPAVGQLLLVTCFHVLKRFALDRWRQLFSVLKA